MLVFLKLETAFAEAWVRGQISILPEVVQSFQVQYLLHPHSCIVPCDQRQSEETRRDINRCPLETLKKKKEEYSMLDLIENVIILACSLLKFLTPSNINV